MTNTINTYGKEIENKMLKLVERVSNADFHKNYSDDSDLTRCKGYLRDVQGGIVLDQMDMRIANLIWLKYSSDGISWSNKDLLYVVDYHIKARMKISAIKMFRMIMNTGLKDAKNFVDARETQLKINGVLDYE
tara:strand:+ start:275 stop:673 length:399 start_codon:yes stop_codon:yes gene_type:complete